MPSHRWHCDSTGHNRRSPPRNRATARERLPIATAGQSSRAAATRPPVVKRQFTADEPNGLWVTDLTFVATWTGVAYVCLIVDAFSRMIVGWRVASHMRTPMVLDAIEMARWSRGHDQNDLRCHSDAGSQLTSNSLRRTSSRSSSPPWSGCTGTTTTDFTVRTGWD